ncbi:MAG: rhodanese-like domain-containing protein [Planctomycetota bacterium]
MNAPIERSALPQVAALGAMLIAVAAVLVIGANTPMVHAESTADAPWLEAIETGGDHIAPADLARELMAGRGDVVVVDTRPADEFAAWHLPGAVRMTVPDVCGTAGRALFAPGPRLVVLCGNGPAHAGQAWVELRRQGHDNVRVLAGGIADFRAELLTPPSLRDGATEAVSKAELPAFALRAAFFLGDGRPNPLATWATDPLELATPTVVSPQWLQQHLGGTAVVDVRPRAEYDTLHVPGAVHVAMADLRAKTGETELFLHPPARLAELLGRLGITAASPVVIAGGAKMQDATLMAAALLSVGHEAFAILEGGVLRWATEKRPLVGEATATKTAVYSPRAAAPFAIGIDELAKRVAAGDGKVLDVRPPDFFRGETSTEARPGHIPGAKNRPYQGDLVSRADGVFWKPRAELERDLAAAGFGVDDDVTVSCRTGHTASETYFVLRYLLGRKATRWYNGSWTEWAMHPELPAAMGER